MRTEMWYHKAMKPMRSKGMRRVARSEPEKVQVRRWMAQTVGLRGRRGTANAQYPATAFPREQDLRGASILRNWGGTAVICPQKRG